MASWPWLAKERGGTYVFEIPILPFVETAMAATTLEQWHERLNHLPKSLVMKMVDGGAVDGLKIISKINDDCLDCHLNKCKRPSHQKRITAKATKAGQSLHFDILGPINPLGLSNQKFVLVCRDEMSSFRMTSSLKSKGQTPEQVKLIINRAELETGNPVLKITSDNGTEFTSERLSIFLEHKGILHVLSAPYTPQQNGTAEREVQNVLCQSSVILNRAKLPQTLWPEAVATSTYVANRCISKLRPHTPYELWFGKRPNVGNLHVFGQQAAVLIPDSKRSKFDTRGKLMIFVGYTDNHQTFKFFDPVSKQIIISCDCSFLNKIGLDPEPVVTPLQAYGERTTVSIPRIEFDFTSVVEQLDQTEQIDTELDDTLHTADGNVRMLN